MSVNLYIDQAAAGGGGGGCIRSEGEIWTHEKETALNSSSECDRFPFRCRQLTERDHRSEAAAWMDDT